MFETSATELSQQDRPRFEWGKRLPEDSHWFAVYTTCRHEKRVAEHLDQRGVPCFLPLYRSQRKWRDGSKVTLELPLFPCYLFVQAARAERGKVLSVPGAVMLVGGTGGQPASLAHELIESLRQGLREQRIEPHPVPKVGRQVRVRSGAFAGMEGIVTRQKNGLRVVLTLRQIMQAISVEVDADDLDLIENVPLSSAWLAAAHA